MSRRLNLGFAALIAMVVFAAAFAISHRAIFPDPKSCVGKVVDNLRRDGLDARLRRGDCRRGTQ